MKPGTTGSLVAPKAQEKATATESGVFPTTVDPLVP